MAIEPSTTGTTPQDDADAAVTPTSGTPEGAGRDGGSGEPDYKTMYLEAKEKVERANELERRLEQIEQERREPMPAATDVVDRTGQIREFEEQARGHAKNGDAVAALILEERAARLQNEQNQILREQLRDTPQDLRKEVYDAYRRGGFGDISHARDHIEKEKLAAKTAKLEAELEKLRRQDKQTEEIRDVPRPTPPEAPTAKTKTEYMTEAQWEDEQKTLNWYDRMARQSDLESGRTVLRG